MCLQASNALFSLHRHHARGRLTMSSPSVLLQCCGHRWHCHTSHNHHSTNTTVSHCQHSVPGSRRCRLRRQPGRRTTSTCHGSHRTHHSAGVCRHRHLGRRHHHRCGMVRRTTRRERRGQSSSNSLACFSATVSPSQPKYGSVTRHLEAQRAELRQQVGLVVGATSGTPRSLTAAPAVVAVMPCNMRILVALLRALANQRALSLEWQ